MYSLGYRSKRGPSSLEDVTLPVTLFLVLASFPKCPNKCDICFQTDASIQSLKKQFILWYIIQGHPIDSKG